MSPALTLASEHVLSDVRTFISRATKLGCDTIRLTLRGNALAMSVGVLWRESLLEATPTVIAVRVSEARSDDDLDTVIDLNALRDRVAREALTVALPEPVVGAIWAGIAPPRDGWTPEGEVASDSLERVAREGIAEVASVSGRGALIVDEVRRTVWSRVMDDEVTALPAGVGLAAFGLGFLAPGQQAQVFRSGSWQRVTTDRGHVLVRSPLG